MKSGAEKGYDPATLPFPIFVGKTAKAMELFGDRLKTLDPEGYIVSVTPSYVVLVGGTGETTNWAQFDFAREYMGVDSYFPAKMGLAAPRHPSVRVPVGTRVEAPVYKNRACWAFNAAGKKGPWGMGDIPWRLPPGQKRYIAEHSIQKYITVKEYGAAHPEYFPMVDGVRKLTDKGDGQAPCISNPEVVKIIIDKVRKFFDENPREDACSMGMTDGGYCECPQCKALDGPAVEIPGCSVDSGKSARWYAFLNQVAKAVNESHPGKIITTFGYAQCDLPPRDLPLEPNIMPFLCATRATWFNPEVRRVYLDIADAWLKRLDQIGVYEYYYGDSTPNPNIYTHDMADYLRHVAKNARSGKVAFFGEINASWGMDGPKVWILEKLLWNPEQDVDALTARWCEAVFEEAAPAMLTYFQTMEQLRVKNGPLLDNLMVYVPWKGKVEKINLQHKFALYQNACPLVLFPKEDVVRCQGILEEARKLAKQDIIKERIDYFASTFKLTEYASKTYHAYSALSKKMWDGAAPDALLATLIEGDAGTSQVDALEYAQLLRAGDNSKFCGPLHLDGCGLAVRKIVQDTAGTRIGELLARGVTDQEKLVGEGRKALMAIAPPSAASTPAGRTRMEALSSVAARVATARRVDTPPAIDGKPDEALWQWVDQSPWFNWQSTVVDTTRTLFAFAYDDQYLYLALRCPQTNLAAMEKCPAKYGAPAYSFPSVEFFLNADQAAGAAAPLSYYQAIPAYGGGFMECGGGGIGAEPQAATYAITDDGKGEWSAELRIDLKKLNLAPADHAYLRINFVRNIGVGGVSGKTWFPSPAAHKDAASRGWLVLERKGAQASPPASK